MTDQLEMVRQTLMRMDEEEIEERLAKNIFSEESRPIAIEVLEYKKTHSIEKKHEPDISIPKRELITVAAIGLVGFLIFNLKKISGYKRRHY